MCVLIEGKPPFLFVGHWHMACHRPALHSVQCQPGRLGSGIHTSQHNVLCEVTLHVAVR